MHSLSAYTAFRGSTLIHHGKLADVALAIKSISSEAHPEGVLIFDNATGSVVDVDFRGNAEEVLARLPAEPNTQEEAVEEVPRGPGRPRLGVVAKEVTLLPRHWEWLSAQSGGASVALRKLVEEARRASAGQEELRLAQKRAYCFMSAMLANEAGLEEAERALFAGNRATFEVLSEPWPADLRDHLRCLAADAFAAEGADS
jgi:hypothetical protein